MIKSGKILLILFLIASSICLLSCGDEDPVFSGSKTGNDNRFLADFDVLNTTINSTMPLSKGDAVEATVDIIKGAIDIVVKNENSTIAYQKKDVDSCKFTIEIAEAGTYTFYITGFKAKGSVYFNKLSR